MFERKRELCFGFGRAAEGKVAPEAEARVGGKMIQYVMKLNQKKSSHVMQTLSIIKCRLPLVKKFVIKHLLRRTYIKKHVCMFN